MSHAEHYTARTLVCRTCGAEYQRRLNRPGDCGACQAARQDKWSRESGARAAAASVSYAVAHGDLPKPRGLACVDCGNSADRYDHRDYNAPLAVEPVCGSCNNRRGPAIHVRHG